MKMVNLNNKISQRESQVLNLIANELTIKEIASRLFISPHTAISHRKNLMQKWEVKNAPGLVRKGFELGVLQVNNIPLQNQNQ